MALRERSGAGEWLPRAKWISSSWSFPVWYRPYQLIAAACMRSCIPRKPGAPRTHASVPHPIPARKTCCDRHGRCGAAASGVQVCRMAVSLSAQRRANERRSNAFASFGRQHMPIRLVNETAGGKIGSVLASVICATQANLLLPDLGSRLTINSPGITSVCLLPMHVGCGYSATRHSQRPLSFLMEPVSMISGEVSWGNANTHVVTPGQAIEYSRDNSDGHDRARRIGYPASAAYDHLS